MSENENARDSVEALPNEMEIKEETGEVKKTITNPNFPSLPIQADKESTANIE